MESGQGMYRPNVQFGQGTIKSICVVQSGHYTGHMYSLVRALYKAYV